MCHEGGWNHGSVRPLGYESRPYPETTGLVLAALRGVRSSSIDLALAAAQRFLVECHSADAFNWLRLGLMAHNQLRDNVPAPADLPRRSVPEVSLDLVASAAIRGKDVLWGS
jgi:hypothetical protein